MSFMPNALPSAKPPIVPYFKLNSKSAAVEVYQGASFSVPVGSYILFDFQLTHVALLNYSKGQNVQRLFGPDKWTLPENPAPTTNGYRGSSIFQQGLVVPTAVQRGDELLAAELLATSIGLRTSIEGLFGQMSSQMIAAGESGHDVVVMVRFDGVKPVAMVNGESHQYLFENPQIVETPQEMIGFRNRFLAVVEHAKNNPPKVPAPISFSPPAAYETQTSAAPMGQGHSHALNAHMSPTMQYVPAATSWQPPVVTPQAIPVQPTATAAWLQPPRAPMAPMAPPAPDAAS